ncbi:palmitoyltransferase pfa5 [Ascosphaera atra]|nr:palmitoyltransferase pfa5 [Ascosphaera atra]
MPQLQNQRTFAIVRTQPGESPFDLGSPFANFKEVMGYRLWEWFVPWTRSPCQDHSHPECGYRLGPVIDRLRKEYGLEPVPGRQAVEMTYAPPAPEPAPATGPVPIPGSDTGVAGADPSVSGAATTDSSLVANISTREHSYHNNHHARSSSRHRPQSTSSSISGSSASQGQTSSAGAGLASLN